MPNLETSVDLNSSPEKFYGFFKSNYKLIPAYSPGTTKSLKVVEEETTPTSLVYTTERFVDGQIVTMTERIEEDKENKSLVATLIKGDALQAYNFVKAVFQIIPKEDGEGSKANLSVEYEKKIENVPSPDAFLTLMVQLTKDIDAGLTKKEKKGFCTIL